MNDNTKSSQFLGINNNSRAYLGQSETSLKTHLKIFKKGAKIPTRVYQGWNELKVLGKLPERRSYHISCLREGVLYVFGGQDLKEGSLNSVWKLDLQRILHAAYDGYK